MNLNKLNGFLKEGSQELIIKTLVWDYFHLLPLTKATSQHLCLALITTHAVQNRVSKGELIINHKKNLIQIISARKSKLVSNNFTCTDITWLRAQIC